MARSRRRPRSTPSRVPAIAVRVAVLLTLATLAVTAWRVRGELVPEESVERLEWSIRPGKIEEQRAWAESRALSALKPLTHALARLDTTRVDGELAFTATLEPLFPIEEGNRTVADALRNAEVDVVDATRLPAEGDAPEEVRITFGLGDRAAGVVYVRASDEPVRRRPRVVLVLDDLGYQSEALTAAFLNVDFPLTTTVLPGQIRSKEVAAQAHALGHEVLLHLPMEPVGYPTKDPGEGAILVDMSDSDIQKLVRRHLKDMPEAVGVSNHMGSFATQNRETMEAVLAVVRDENLYFFDSKTSRKSLAAKIAREMSVPCVENDLFLDHDIDPERIRERLDQVVRQAKKHGAAIGIFHPHEACLEAIPPAVAAYEEEGIEFVRLGDLDPTRWVGALPSARRLP